MTQRKHIIKIFSIALIINAGLIAAIRLSSLNYKSASVLPYYHDNKGEKWVILSREAFGKDKNTYDDFGGARDVEKKQPTSTTKQVSGGKRINITRQSGGIKRISVQRRTTKKAIAAPATQISATKIKNKTETHPVVSAAREFYEEAILKETIGLDDVKQTIQFLKNNSEYILSYAQHNGCDPHNKRDACNVTYIADFNQYKDQFFKNFYIAREQAKKFTFKEKDRIAVVSWKNLQNAIVGSNSWVKRFFSSLFSKDITVSAMELDPHTLNFKPTTITLRPWLVKKLRPFFLNKPYQQGMNKKIRHYSE
jgi:hypothetical protein